MWLYNFSSILQVIDLIYPHKFSIILEMDYGTPFDRHTIIEDSHETKKKRKWNKLEEPTSSGKAKPSLVRLSSANRGFLQHMKYEVNLAR